jgi:uncharacterized damage-inducible protein DinB
MNASDFDELFRYDLWATNRVIDAAERADDSGLWTQLRGHGAGSVRDMVVHVADAALLWLDRIKGRPVNREPVGRFSSFEEVRSHAAACNAALRDFVREQGDAGINDASFEYLNNQGIQERMPIRRILLQLYTHGVGHRAEASELLTAAGLAPEQLDIIAWYRAHPNM